jgi:hypothetical protein
MNSHPHINIGKTLKNGQGQGLVLPQIHDQTSKILNLINPSGQ